MKIDATKFFQRIDKVEDIPELTMKNAYPFLRNETPIRTGNARNKTKRNQLKIKSNYGYAGRLDEGWSKQSPKGFTDPTIKFIERFINTQVGKI